MKKNILVISLSLALLISSCTDGQNTFPKTVSVSRSDSLIRVKGTKFFAKIPNDYKPITSIVRYQKNDNTYFQIVEVPNGNFTEQKEKMSKTALESQGAKVDVYEKVKYNGFDGIYSEGPSKIDGETKIGLVFGDETFVTMVVGVCSTKDKNAKEELKNIFSNSYYDKSYKLNPLELANFEIDESITGFKYATTIGNIFFYTPSGKADMKTLLDFSCYEIMPLEAKNIDNVIELLGTINSRFSLQGVRTSNLKETEMTINGNKAIEVSMDAQDKQNKKGSFYEVLIFNAKSSSGVIFIGTDVDNGTYLDKFKATAQSINIKL